MSELLIAVTFYCLFILSVTVIHTRQVLHSNQDVMWNVLSDSLILLFIFIAGPYFIITEGTILSILLWGPTMFMYLVFAILYLLD